MRSNQVTPGQNGLSHQYVNLRHDARGASFILAHQQLGALALPIAPSDGDTVTLVVNGQPMLRRWRVSFSVGR